MTDDEFKTAIQKTVRELIDERNAAHDEAKAYQSIFDFLIGYARDDFPILLDTAGKALGGRQAEIAEAFIERAKTPREEIRFDHGGWISGPCLDEPAGLLGFTWDEIEELKTKVRGES